MTEKMNRKDFFKVMGATMLAAPFAKEALKEGVRAPVAKIGEQKAVLVDSRRCIGCKGCQVACKAWNELPAEKTDASQKEFTNPLYFSPITWKVVHFKEIGDYDNPGQAASSGGCWRTTASIASSPAASQSAPRGLSGSVATARSSTTWTVA